MKRIKSLETIHIDGRSVVTLGKFDGVHRGHRKLIRRVHELADGAAAATVFTFDVSPQTYLGRTAEEAESRNRRPEDPDGSGGKACPGSDDAKTCAEEQPVPEKYRTLLTAEERAEVLDGLDIDLLVECPFTEAVRTMTPEAFVRDILAEKLHIAAAVVGDDFRFGRNRAGTPEFLREIGGKFGFSTEIISKEKDGARDISSTYVREELSAGHMEKVNGLLGYPFFVTGEIVHGRHLGHTLGFPTINQIPDPGKALPPNGVYSSRVLVDGKWYRGLSNVGTKPTVHGGRMGVETYLYDCDLDLYGLRARTELLDFRRPEKKFSTVEELNAQVQRDISDAANC